MSLTPSQRDHAGLYWAQQQEVTILPNSQGRLHDDRVSSSPTSAVQTLFLVLEGLLALPPTAMPLDTQGPLSKAFCLSWGRWRKERKTDTNKR